LYTETVMMELFDLLKKRLHWAQKSRDQRGDWCA
jgi:hypothetical protein